MAKRGKNKEAVAIAKDVIEQIELRKYVATPGTYMRGLRLKTGDLQNQLTELLDERAKKCSVCALGSAFLSAVRLYDKFNVESGGSSIGAESMMGKLEEFFTQEEIGRIEAAFELSTDFLQGKDHSNPNWSISMPDSPMPFFIKLVENLTPENRLLTIMREVVRQNGGFDGRTADRFSKEVFKHYLARAIEEAYDAR